MEQNQEARIRERAYAIWIEDGCPDGCDGEHWYRAEREIAALTAPVPATIEVAAPKKPARKPRQATVTGAGAEAPTAAGAAVRKPRARKKAEQPAS